MHTPDQALHLRAAGTKKKRQTVRERREIVEQMLLRFQSPFGKLLADSNAMPFINSKATLQLRTETISQRNRPLTRRYGVRLQIH